MAHTCSRRPRLLRSSTSTLGWTSASPAYARLRSRACGARLTASGELVGRQCLPARVRRGGQAVALCCHELRSGGVEWGWGAYRDGGQAAVDHVGFLCSDAAAALQLQALQPGPGHLLHQLLACPHQGHARAADDQVRHRCCHPGLWARAARYARHQLQAQLARQQQLAQQGNGCVCPTVGRRATQSHQQVEPATGGSGAGGQAGPIAGAYDVAERCGPASPSQHTWTRR